jgi:MFS family permease
MDSVANPVVQLAAPADDHDEIKAGVDDKQNHEVTTKGPVTALDIERQNANEDIFPGDVNSPAAWWVLFGCWVTLFPAFGLMVSIGTLQDYWHGHQLADYNPRDIGWISGVFVYLALALGICVGPLFDRYGPRWIALIGSCLYVAMTFLLAECREYWHFMLCLGVLGGASGATLTTTGLAVVSHWFKKKRGLAAGIAMIGSSFGGVVIPLILRSTLPKYGYQWAVRILGFIFMGCLTTGNILMKPRLPPSPAAKNQSIFSLHLFGDPSFSFLTVSVFGVEIVLFGSLGILPTYASTSTDFPADTGFYLIAVMNGVSCLGRIIPGFVSDVYGRFNVFGVMMAATLIIMLVIWLPFGHTDLGALYTFVALFGFGTGSWM